MIYAKESVWCTPHAGNRDLNQQVIAKEIYIHNDDMAWDSFAIFGLWFSNPLELVLCGLKGKQKMVQFGEEKST